MTELNITLTGNGHLYEQIYKQIKDEIIEGKLLCGERLPSTRLLAEFLTVSRTTAQMAYDQLLSEGYIESRPQRGYFVCDVGDMYTPAKEMRGRKENRDLLTDNSAQGDCQRDAQYRSNLSSGRNNALFSDRNQEEKKTDDNSGYIDFSPRSIDMTAFPYATWKKITREILVDSRSSMFSSGHPQGDAALRHAIARYLQLARGVDCSAGQIVIGAGSDYLLMLLGQITGRRKAAVEVVTYTRARQIMERIGYDTCSVSMDENGIDTAELDRLDADIVYVMPSHQYPTGIVMPVSRRSELLQWASAGDDRYIIEDDYDSEFRYKGKPIPSLQASDRHGKVIYMGTFSKSIAPAIRVSYMVLPKALLELYHDRCSCFSCTVPRIDQSILTMFLENGHFERYLNKMRRIYRMKHDIVLRELAPVKDKAIITGADAGLHLLLTRKGDISDKKEIEDQLIYEAMARGVKIYGLSEFLTGDADRLPETLRQPTVILGFASLTEDEICRGAGILIELIHKL